MTVLRGGYEGARTCTGGPEPGTKNLMAAFLAIHGGNGGYSLGIYNCRTVRGASTTSVHGEGRAGDHGCRTPQGWMEDWCNFLIAYSAELGVQCVIYNRQIWSSSYPDGKRAYRGRVPHTDHAHVEQTRASARTLTVARVMELWNAYKGRGGGGGKPAPVPSSVGRPLVRRGTMNSEHVRVLQDNLRRRFPAYRHSVGGGLIGVDGDFGPQTEKWVREFQRRSNIGVDGIVGPQTWRALGLA